MADHETEYVLVTEYFHPETASTGQLMTDLAVGLQDRGLDLTVYTGQPNYHSGDNDRQPRESTHEGVDVRRIRAPQVRQSSLLRRCFNWVMFTVWMFLRLLISRTDRNRELIVVSNPPFLPGAMWLACRLRGWEYTFIVYDVYPDMAVESGYFRRGGIIDEAWSAGTQRILRDAKNIVALGPEMREKLLEHAGPEYEPERIKIIDNWEDEEFIEPKAKGENWFAQQHDLLNEFILLYSGNIGDNHDLETVVRAAPEFESGMVKILIIGEGDEKERIEGLADSLDVLGDTVRFLPYQDLEDLPFSLTAGDVSLVTVSEGMKGVCVSSKLYTCMAAGMPILVISEPGDDEARIVEKYGAGVHATQGDVEAIVETINHWMENPSLVEQQGANARRAFEENFTKKEAIDDYYHLLSNTE